MQLLHGQCILPVCLLPDELRRYFFDPVTQNKRTSDEKDDNNARCKKKPVDVFTVFNNGMHYTTGRGAAI
ncbi:MAG TPA: hypothetical protein VE978_00105 [Chitinophagales bacterium]|nr:hypothetical protein [Chitinophagales bacterium]